MMSVPFRCPRDDLFRLGLLDLVLDLEVERELDVFSHPAQRRLAIRAMAAHDKRFPVTGR